MLTCVLCHSEQVQLYYQDANRDYWQCACCQLVFVDPTKRLSSAAEKAVYDLHENYTEDLNYRGFLSRLATPLLTRLHQASHGLDFGCGNGPALAAMLTEAGHKMALYDHFYYPDKSVLSATYDVITATEVIEHLYQPDKIWQQWLDLLKPNGWLCIMTKRVQSAAAFATWHYKNDPTHVLFFSEKTFEFLAQRDKLILEFIDKDVVFLRKYQS